MPIQVAPFGQYAFVRRGLVWRIAACALVAFTAVGCGDDSKTATPPDDEPVFGAVECGDPRTAGLLEVAGQHLVRVVLPPDTPESEVLQLTSKFDSTVSTQTRELMDAGIWGQQPPDCETPALILSVKDGTDLPGLEFFIRQRSPALRIE